MGKIALKCDKCGKVSWIRESKLYAEQIEAVQNNNGCYCSKCGREESFQVYRTMIFAGDVYTVFPKVIPLEFIKQLRSAKGIAERARKVSGDT